MEEKERRTRWFHYSVEDAKAAQAELDELAAEGWELEELGLFTASFRRTESPRPCWVEPARWRSIKQKDAERQTEYLELCQEAGWELLDEAGGLWYFQGREGEHPTPVQTDETVEWETVWRKILFDQACNILFLGIFWTVHFWVRLVWKGFFLWEALLSNYAIALTLCLQLMLLAEIGYGIYLLSYRRRCRQAVRTGEPLPIPRRWGARLRGSLRLGAGLVIAAALLVMLASVEEGQTNYMEHMAGYTRATSSICADHWTYRLFQSSGDVWVESYDCRVSWLADCICADLVGMEADEEKLEKDLHYHGAVVPRPADLGFDQAWSYNVGEKSGLILRNGDKIVRVEVGGVDLTNPDILIELSQALFE